MLPVQGVCNRKITLLRRWAAASRAYSRVLLKTYRNGLPIAEHIYAAQRECQRRIKPMRRIDISTVAELTGFMRLTYLVTVVC